MVLMQAVFNIGVDKVLFSVITFFLAVYVVYAACTIVIGNQLRSRFPKKYKTLVWIDGGILGFIPLYSKWFSFIWREKFGDKQIMRTVVLLRILQALMSLAILSFFILASMASSRGLK